MKIQINRDMKIVLLSALKEGILDTSQIPELENSMVQIIYRPTPLSEEDIEDIRRIESGND